MARTFHEQGMEEQAYEALDTVKNATKAIKTVRQAILEREWDPKYVAVIGQPERSGWPIGQLWAAALIHDGVVNGEILTRRIHVGESPHMDKMRVENAAILARMPYPWQPWLDEGQNCAESDGTLTWTERCRFLQSERDDAPDGAWVGVDAGSAPLEVGTTKASRTWFHLLQSRAVARWPYGDDHVTVLYMASESDLASFPRQPIDDERTAARMEM